MCQKGIQDLPEEVVEYILSLLSPYRDLKNCMLVCKDWQKYVRGVVRRMQYDFQRSITEMNLVWDHLVPSPGPTITKRYLHSTCCHGTSMYVFGGCTITSTTFNDLWRLDLATREWIRPLAMGTYPSPKACSTLVCHKDNLYLFGGWTHPPAYPLHQPWKMFKELHVYNPGETRWTQIVSQPQPPAMAGHSATVHRDNMIIFGGLQRQSNGQPFARSNDLWVLNLTTLTWRHQTVKNTAPPPRYGQTQIEIDENHALVVGGCGGPNTLFSDMWVLTMYSPYEPWEWTKMEIENSQDGAPHLWCHPACRIGNKLVVVSRAPYSTDSPTRTLAPIIRRTLNRAWVPPVEAETQRVPQFGREPHVEDENVNGRQGTFRRPSNPSASNQDVPAPSETVATDSQSQQSSPENVPMDISSPGPSTSSSNSIAGVPSTSSSNIVVGPSTSGESSSEPRQTGGSDSDNDSSNPENASSSAGEASCSFSRPTARNTQFPSIRPNPMRNRQRQLEGLRRMEERIRTISQRNPQLPSNSPGGRSPSPNRQNVPSNQRPMRSGGARNPMVIYVADISKILKNSTVAWLPVTNLSPPDGPEDTILYSLVEGRGELVMFGGIHKEPRSASAGSTGGSPETLSNAVHFISPQKWVI